jgi:hypothetical protein
MPAPVETKPPGTSVALAPAGAPAGGSATEPAAGITATPSPEGGDHANLRPYAWGVGIAAGVGLALGTVEGIIAIKKRNEFNDHMGQDPNTLDRKLILDCNTTAPTADCKSIQDSWSRARTLSIVGFVAGAVLAGGAAALWVVSSPKEHSGTALACAPDLGSRGLGCRLEF